MKKYIYLTLVVIVTLFFNSCYEDKGNYDYSESKQISVEGIDEKGYDKIAFKDVLKIEPIIKKTTESDEFTYLWTVYPKVKDEYESAKGFKIDTISTDKNLNFEIKLKPGIYTISCNLINKSKRDLGFFVTTELRVSTEFSEGFYILKEIDGNTEMDFINNENSTYPDLLKRSLGSALKGKPLSLGYYPTFSYLNEVSASFEEGRFLFPISNDDFVMLNIDGMTKQRELSDMFYNEMPLDEKPLAIFPGVLYASNYISNKGIYNSYQMPAGNMWSAGQFASKGAYFDDLGYELHFNTILIDFASYAYDTKNGRFIHIDFNADLHKIDDAKSNNIKDNLLFLGYSVSGVAYGYGIFESADKSERLLYIIEGIDPMGKKDFAIAEIRTIDKSLKFATATKFATNKKGATMIYFLSGNKLYAYNIMSGTETELKIDGLSSYDEITYFDTMYFMIETNKDKHFNYLMIGTSKGDEYAVDMYDMIGGLPSGTPKRTLKGKGKVCTMQYVTPDKRNTESVESYSGLRYNTSISY